MSDDTIYRREAIEAVKELCEHYTPTKSVNHSHMDFVIEELQNLPSAQPEQQWIPCSEKQVEASCLACDKFGQMFITTSIVVINHKCYDGTDFDFAKPDDFLKGVNIGHGMRVLPREIIAWMPLPEPYTERRTE